MNTKFAIGSRVQCVKTAQLLTVGRIYKVIDTFDDEIKVVDETGGSGLFYKNDLFIEAPIELVKDDIIKDLNEELNKLRGEKQKIEEEFLKKMKEINVEREKIRNSLPELYGIVMRTNTKASRKLVAGEIYSLDYDDDMDPTFRMYSRNYNERDTESNYCPYCCKMKIVKYEELTDEQRSGVIYNVSR